MERLVNISVDLARQLHPPLGELSFYPSYDGDYITILPSVSLRKGDFVKDVPLIAAWVRNDGSWYAPPTIDNDEAIVQSITAFVSGLSKKSLDRFLELYPASDFEHLVTTEPMVTSHYWRAAQIHRDLWFACPTIDFTWQYARHSSAVIRLYEMNQTRWSPAFEAIGFPHWRVGHLSDIPFILNNPLVPEGDNSPSQLKLASLLSGSAAAFAYTGDPTNSEGSVISDWPQAYSLLGGQGLSGEHPTGMSVQIIGGEYGTGPATLARSGQSSYSPREVALASERLFERCEFINSIQEEISV
ncbi:MAG: hypothetical protein CYPHOPRED_002311 [Cyphobasidiales sp. Tagirdzhanova-0007]|nr:MAG: hypothetical protein CYPHOPRED_002311 [Cyphobasidiales sp. Tagirdzhanova-0007]